MRLVISKELPGAELRREHFTEPVETRAKREERKETVSYGESEVA